jgi:hypothetical protein
MPRRRHNPERDVVGAEIYVRLVDPDTGAAGFVAIGPAIRPDSALRFHRGRPVSGARGVPLHPVTHNAAERGTPGVRRARQLERARAA